MTNQTHAFTLVGAGGTCPSCQAELLPDARFCGSCGTPSSGAEATVPQQRTAVFNTYLPNALPASSRFGRLRNKNMHRVLVPGVAVALVGGLVLVGIDDMRQRSHLHSTAAKLTATSQTLRTTKALLASTRSDLEARQSELSDTQSQLKSANSSLQADERQLTGVRNSLSDAQTRISLQAGQIDNLKSCLNGVSTALGDAAYGDYTSALSALDAVQVSCNEADKLVN